VEHHFVDPTNFVIAGSDSDEVKPSLISLRDIAP